MVLHTLNATAMSPAYRDCLQLLRPGDAVLLLGDGVYAGLAGSAAARDLVSSGAQLYALEPDARAAGVQERLVDAIALTDYRGFVALSERFSQQQAWY